ncbi:hypothetical protein Gogos_022247, partial [Gossypium gossypioides]|nr:hypothetical protein [Gossypium gossypioides]
DVTVREGDVEGVESDSEGDVERVESIGEGDLEGVQADGEGVCATGIEVDECGGVESSEQISLGSTVGEDNDSKVIVDDMLVILQHLMEWIMLLINMLMNMEAWLGPMKMKNMKMDEHHCSVSFKNKMVTAAMVTQHFEATIKDHPKMKLREIQRRCPSEIHRG